MQNVERLEKRQLFSADASFSLTSKGTLIVEGTDGNDVITATLIHGNTSGTLNVSVVPASPNPNAFSLYHQINARYLSVKRILIDGGDGNDRIDINCMQITKPVTLLGGNGDDTITYYTRGPIMADGQAGNDVIGEYPSTIYVDKNRNRDVLDETFAHNENTYENTILGGDGDDSIQGDMSDQIDGGNGNDTIQVNIFNETNSPLGQRANDLAHDFSARIGATGIEIYQGFLLP